MPQVWRLMLQLATNPATALAAAISQVFRPSRPRIPFGTSPSPEGSGGGPAAPPVKVGASWRVEPCFAECCTSIASSFLTIARNRIQVAHGGI